MKQSWVLWALILKGEKEVKDTGNWTIKMINPECLGWKVKSKRIIIVGETKGEWEPTGDKNTDLLGVKG